MQDKPSGEIGKIEQELPFQRKEWVVQRIGWVFLFLIVIAGLFGLTGKGSIINLDEIITRSDDGTLTVKHEKYFRREADDKLTFIVSGAETGEFRIGIGNAFLKDVHIEQIIPEPESQEITAFGIQYKFSTSDSKPNTEIYFYFKAMKAGNISASFMAPSGSKADFQTFVYP